jgi:hypothetical protein
MAWKKREIGLLKLNGFCDAIGVANSNKLLNVVRGSTPMRIFSYDAANI